MPTALQRLHESVNNIQTILDASRHVLPTVSAVDAVTKLIVLSGDISDVDGFYGLAKYAQSGADVLFVMNYPAYLQQGIKNSDTCTVNESGLGYSYGLEAVETITLQNHRSHPNFDAYTEFLASCSNSSFTRNKVFQTALDRMAFFVANKVWEDSPSTVAKGKLFFVSGGINSINPFHVSAIKNELLVYAPLLKANGYFDGEQRPATSRPGIISKDSADIATLAVFLSAYTRLYLDFSGSMAFYDAYWQHQLNVNAASIKACVIMGGVQTNTAPTTMPAIENTLNRFSCSTMNQLYHPAFTYSFLSLLARTTSPTFVISNNAVQLLLTQFRGKNTDVGWELFVRNNGIYSPFLEKLAQEYYNSPYNSPPHKAFDYYSAFVLSEYINNQTSLQKKGVPKNLVFDGTYGISLVSDQPTFPTAVRQYISNIDITPVSTDPPFIAKKKLNFQKETELLPRISDVRVLPIMDMTFILNPVTHQLSISQ
jgi:hypothetical protein